jgi:hypothetical protein
MNILLPTAYLGNIEYYSLIKRNGDHLVEVLETYPKQTFRNRCTILGANGCLDLVVPIKKKSGEKTKTSEVEISYAEQWQRVHWNAIQSAYNSSPFFEYYADILLPFYNKQFRYLIDFNTDLHGAILKMLKMKVTVGMTVDFVPHAGEYDFRLSLSPKKKPLTTFSEYYQVFSYKTHFVENLSIIDLIFNEGPRAHEFL